MQELTRQDMIEQLIDDSLDTLAQLPEYAESIMREGFIGFNNYTDEQLKAEYKARFED